MAKIRPGAANGRTAVTASAQKKTAKIDDFRSGLREKIDFLQKLEQTNDRRSRKGVRTITYVRPHTL